MDRATFSFLAHAGHRICGPLSEARCAALLDRLQPPAGGRALDVGCGKAAVLLDLVARRALAEGIGLDTNPHMLGAARAEAAERGLADRVRILERDGRRLSPGPDGPALPPGGDGSGPSPDLGRFDAIVHLGGPLVEDRVDATLAVIAAGLVPGGRALFATGFWARTPDPDFAARLGAGPDELVGPADLAPLAAAAGLAVIHQEVASHEEWEGYETLYLGNIEAWAAGRVPAPGLPRAADLPPAEVQAALARVRDWHADWRAHGEDTLAMAFHVIERPPAT